MALQFQQEWQRIQRLCSREPKLRLRRLTLASGVLLSGALMVRLMPLPGLGSDEAEPIQDSLWRSTGVVRQSVVDLYRIQRSQQQEEAPSEVAADSTTDSPSPASPEKSTAASQSAPQTATATQAQPQAPDAAAVVVPENVIDNVLEMRVAIARNLSSLDVGASSLGWVIDTDGTAHCDIPAQTSVTAYPTATGIDFGGCQLSGAVWLEADAGGYVFVKNGWFKGRVLVFNDGGQIVAVNFVRLGDYLSSVVGSEMYHHWPLEALKAQAVAARSYALTHHVRPASDYFDLDNTQRFQAYKGINMETINTQRAVAETGGEFISYQGGIVESLYAASDQIVQEAHGGQGMSQHGAKDHAVNGYSYEQILGVYYPGTNLSRLVVD
ncbi:SpoIID/LytB domain-containing protein [Oscillatoria sp. CS-180]|uniref:SpoIID/LytB domain-containing protein n=1 Tax=Oscillatoria sp. CS-180 TaxID=3021720 RepID=UPI00232C0555|nr:SpoIID/LytB domain-containing protein [Oscillatoria sp. CS-180]MDB9526687.1 SpoIID/LytB domain-containing protein [Oscillatoria sp. CS-180]